MTLVRAANLEAIAKSELEYPVQLDAEDLEAVVLHSSLCRETGANGGSNDQIEEGEKRFGTNSN